MPIKIPNQLPAMGILQNENIFIMDESRAIHQDIRPLQILLVNLMPTKITTETQLLRLLGNTPLQTELTLLRTSTHQSKNTPEEHLLHFYHTFDEVQDQKYDGLIITGAPVEQMAFEEVDYWSELTGIMDWATQHVFASLFICWGAQAALYHYYQIPKYPLKEKMFGVFEHRVLKQNVKLLRGFDDMFYAPHSRHTEVLASDIEKVETLDLLACSEIAGVYLAARKDGRQVFVTGHSEYDPLTLKTEYDRDVALNLPIHVPLNYYPEDDPTREPVVRWRSHANLLFSNWINYCVYQETPYDLNHLFLF